MYNAKRDSVGGSPANAIPSMGGIEGRITVLEVVAMTSLTLLLRTGDKHAAQQVLSLIRRAMREKCNDMHLDKADAASAIVYAQDLLDVTLEHIDFSGPKSLEDDLLIA